MSWTRRKRDKVAVENAPSILDFLDEESQAHFDAVRQIIWKLSGRNHHRYQYGTWSRTITTTPFSSLSQGLRAMITVCAGGRTMAVCPTSVVELLDLVFGLGVERLLLVLEKQGVNLPIENALNVYIAVLGEKEPNPRRP